MGWPLFCPKSIQTVKDLTVVIPCYKEDKKLITELYNKLSWLGCHVIVIDDGGDMALDFDHLWHRPNMGYGYAIKRGIKHAETSIVCTIDGDGQHTVEDVQKIYQVYKMVSNCKMVIGQRWGLKEGRLRRLGRKILNSLASVISNHYMVDLNSGIRIFDRNLALGYSPILCDTFSFTTSLTMSFLTDGHKITWLPVDVQERTYGKSHVRLAQDGIVTLYYILWVGFGLRTRGLRKWIRRILGR